MSEEKVFVPPLKIQGIKTKLVPQIKEYALLKKDTLWIEPFMGSGVVGFNVAPFYAVFADTNPHIIQFYAQIQTGKITAPAAKTYLQAEGKKLSEYGAEYYYFVRDRFNKEGDPLDFLFLNRSCFNGMMRFNKNGDFNVPFGHKPERFSKAYITKIINQIAYVEEKIKKNRWTFLCQPFTQTLTLATPDSFVYCDPPYIGRHVDYYNRWTEEDEAVLCQILKNTDASFMLSTWERTKFRENETVQKEWRFCQKRTKEHFYHVGASEENRNAVIEALLMNYIPAEMPVPQKKTGEQLSFFEK